MADIFEPDPSRLDEEWIAQPRLFYNAAVEAAESRSAQSAAKAALDVVQAELQAEIRSDPGSYGIEKVTEAAISAAISTHKKYRRAQQDLIDATFQVHMMDAKVQALDHRKRALENLVTLHGQNYFSTPRAKTSAAREVMDEVVKKDEYAKIARPKKRKTED